MTHVLKSLKDIERKAQDVLEATQSEQITVLAEWILLKSREAQRVELAVPHAEPEVIG